MLPTFSPETLTGMINAGMEAALPKAIQDATAEVVSIIVQEQMRNNVIPQMAKSLAGAGFLPAMQREQPAILAKAGERALSRGNLDQQPKGLTYDPFTALDQMGFRERPTLLGYHTLQEMARRCPPMTAILQTRTAQMAALAVPQPDPYSLGFRLRLRDKDAEMTPQLKKRAQELTDWIVRCGNPKVKAKRDKFGAFIKKYIWDSLSIDQACAEIIPARNGSPSWWRVLDGATMRISDDLDEVNDDPDATQYVQTYDETIIAEFKESEMIFGVRNPRSDIRYSGYGTSELEMLIVIVTALLNAIDYNASFFQNGTVAKGILNFKGAIPDRELEAFRRQWHAMVSGVVNAWRTPVVNSDEVQWINMNQSPRDLEFSQFMDWLLKMGCAVYLVAPEEIGFQFGNTGQSSTMNEGGIADKLEYSKDKGLVPLATSTAEVITDKIVEPIDDRFVFEFTGINARTREQAIELHTKEVSSVRTVDEVRKERGDEPLPDGKGAIILNAVFQQMSAAADQAKMAQGQPQPGPQLDQNGLDQPATDQDQQGQPDNGQPIEPGGQLGNEAGQDGEQMMQSQAPKRSGLSPNQRRAMALVKSLTVDVEL